MSSSFASSKLKLFYKQISIPFNQNLRKINSDQLSGGQTRGKPRVLVAPLDWGLGHATRCIPIIHQLLQQQVEVFIAGEGAQAAILKEEFPNLQLLKLKGYRAVYAKSSIGLMFSMIRQSGKFLRAIRDENKWLARMMKQYQFDAVISDNRYGLHHRDTFSIFITHQLNIKAPYKWLQKILLRKNYRYISKFDECWVPDVASGITLAGELSHPNKLPEVPIKYIGPLTRMKRLPVSIVPKKILVLLSGPEPQRSLLEEKIFDQVIHYNGPVTIVRGLPQHQSFIPSTNMIKIHNHLNAAELQDEINESAWVIARSGYSSVMDLLALKKKTVLIPTPGQTEQEYLGKHLQDENLAVCVSQQEFSMEKALNKASEFPYREFNIKEDSTLQETILHLLGGIRERRDQLG